MEQRKKLKSQLIAIMTSLTMMSSVSCVEIKEDKDENTFQTRYGMKNLSEYEDFLNENGIDIKNAKAHADEDDVTISEKNYSNYIVQENNPNTIEGIIDFYNMDKNEFLELNNLEETEELKIGQKLTIYYIKYYHFSLDELEESKKWIIHNVKQGETLTDIAQEYDITIDQILEENENIIDPNYITPNTKIKINKNKDKIKTK